MIGIIGAMSIEVEEIKSKMTDTYIEVISCIEYNIGLINGKKCVVAVSGVGKVNAAVCTQTMIIKYSPEYIINTGVAGGISSEINVGDVAVARSVVQHDMDTSAIGDPIGFISGINIVNIPCSDKLVDLAMETSQQFKDINFYEGVISTGDQFINNIDKINHIKLLFNPIACEMEGASIGQVCCINGVDFVVIRSISDSANDDSCTDYQRFLKRSAKISSGIVMEIIRKL